MRPLSRTNILELGLVRLGRGRIGGEQRRADYDRDDHRAAHDALLRGARLAKLPFRYSIPGAAVTTDEYEIWFDRGVTDGLPVVPPTRERVVRMLAGTKASAGELLGYTYCIAEHEEASPRPPYHVEQGHGISDHASRTAHQLAGSLGWSMTGLWNSKHFPLYSHTMLVVGPEHARTFADDGWSKADLRRALHETIRRPDRELLPDDDHGQGTNLRYGKAPPGPGALIPKFPSVREIHVVVAGGTAGRFSVAIPGWLGTKNGSSPVTRVIEFG